MHNSCISKKDAKLLRDNPEIFELIHRLMDSGEEKAIVTLKDGRKITIKRGLDR